MTIAQLYLDNCYVMKLRLIWSRRLLEKRVSLIDFENLILSIRKIIEAISFCCLISAEIRSGQVPRQIMNSWNAEEIFKFLKRKKLLHLPDFARLKLEREGRVPDSPSTWRLDIQDSKDEEIERLVSIYRQCHKFLHEFNPYLGTPLRDDDFEVQAIKNCEHLKIDHRWIWNRFWQHSVRIEGKIFFVDFRDDNPESSPHVIRTDNMLADKDFDFAPLQWGKVFPD